MRLVLCAAAAALTMVAAPASAAVYVVGIGGSLTGNTTTFLCTAPGCTGPTQHDDPYSGSFSTMVGSLNLVQGDNALHYGSLYSGGLFDGIINNNNGVLTGLNLTYTYQTCPPGVPSSGCRLTTAKAATFAVSGGVPEPATWALMLLGFGAIGTALRRRRHSPVRVSFAA